MSRLSIILSKEARDIYNKVKPHDKSKYVSDAIVEKHNREKGIIFTPEQIEYLNKYYIRKDDV